MDLKFPAWYSFHLTRDLNTGKLDIIASNEKSKTDAGNRKYKALKRYSWDGLTQFAILDIEEIKSEDHFKEKFMKLHELWIDPVLVETT